MDRIIFYNSTRSSDLNLSTAPSANCPRSPRRGRANVSYFLTFEEQNVLLISDSEIRLEISKLVCIDFSFLLGGAKSPTPILRTAVFDSDVIDILQRFAYTCFYLIPIGRSANAD